jgi:hypothetical protein
MTPAEALSRSKELRQTAVSALEGEGARTMTRLVLDVAYAASQLREMAEPLDVLSKAEELPIIEAEFPCHECEDKGTITCVKCIQKTQRERDERLPEERPVPEMHEHVYRDWQEGEAKEQWEMDRD